MVAVPQKFGSLPVQLLGLQNLLLLQFPQRSFQVLLGLGKPLVFTLLQLRQLLVLCVLLPALSQKFALLLAGEVVTTTSLTIVGTRRSESRLQTYVLAIVRYKAQSLSLRLEEHFLPPALRTESQVLTWVLGPVKEKGRNGLGLL